MTTAGAGTHPRAAVGAALLLLAGSVPFALAASRDEVLGPLTLMLGACALVSVLNASTWEGGVQISAAFSCYLLAAALVGPLGAFAVALASELGGWLLHRSRPAYLAANLAAVAVPSLWAGLAFQALAGRMTEGGSDIAALALVAVGFLGANFVLVRTLGSLVDGGSLKQALRHPREILPSLALTVGLTLAVAGAYVTVGIATAAFIVVVVVAFTYMSRLVVIARERTGQYAALSWGVLSALVRSLDSRDSRTARHSAAVAAFARDIALQSGLSRRDADLAHTAGLLHDIGRFALPDRVMERQGTLTEHDWRHIDAHPQLGADLLRDLGVYGPVATIVRSHHERIDGRGYPDGLAGDEIHRIARIVAVAEVYDTLTGPDTYRNGMTSFEAITEMRRVAGCQLDEQYVEALASLLAGRGTDYRHADDADFDAELLIERRIADSIATDSRTGSGIGGLAARSSAIVSDRAPRRLAAIARRAAAYARAPSSSRAASAPSRTL